MKINQILKQKLALLAPRDTDWRSRINEISAFFLGCAYLNGALGEGSDGRFDQSPLYRLDVFDCLTYVNMVLALFFADDIQSFQQNMADFNYRNGVVAYENRHHFMNIDWNSANIHQGLLEDITCQIVDHEQNSIALTSRTFIDRPGWFRHRQFNDIKLETPISAAEGEHRLAELHALANGVSAEVSCINYLPLVALFDTQNQPKMQLFSQIPDASIIEIVRPNWDLRQKIGTYLDVSHLGFVFYCQDSLMFRHASAQENKVSEVSLIQYLSGYINNDTIKGIHVLRLLPHIYPCKWV